MRINVGFVGRTNCYGQKLEKETHCMCLACLTFIIKVTFLNKIKGMRGREGRADSVVCERGKKYRGGDI